jgi:hypothetical protein
VVAWGWNYYGQTNVPAGLRGVIAIAASYHTVALKSDGTVVAWGYNDNGQASVPAELSNVTAIAAGGRHTVALKSDGTVVAWGDNSSGQTNTPPWLSGVKAIAAGYAHTIVLKSDGTLVTWGDNGFGQTDVPAGLNGVRAIATQSVHTVALKRDGTLVAWGNNSEGEIDIPAGLRGVMAIDVGNAHTVALKSSYRFSGFLGPVNMPPVINTLRAGEAVPVKFSLGGNKGLDIFANGYPASRTVSCNADAATDEIEQTVQAGSSALRYDAGTGTYTYIWKTGQAWAGQCRRLILRLADGIEHTALFRFR